MRNAADDLEITENRSWQERFWTFQRFSWAAMLVFILAALLGVTGSGGPVSTGQVKAAGATVTYPRVARWQSAAEMTVELPPQLSGPVDVEVSSEVLEIFGVDGVSPTPNEASATVSGHRYRFEVMPGQGNKRLVIHLRAMRAALPRSGQVRIANGPPINLRFVALP